MHSSPAHVQSSMGTWPSAAPLSFRVAPAAHPILQQPGVPQRVERIASAVAHRHGVVLREHDLADCSQHAWEALIPSFRRFDPQRGDGASLLTRVVTNATKRWLTRRIAGARDCRREMALPDHRKGGDIADLSSHDRMELRLLVDDLWSVVRSLPAEQRAVMVALAHYGHQHAAARRSLGWTREHYDAVRARVGRALIGAGLGDA